MDGFPPFPHDERHQGQGRDRVCPQRVKNQVCQQSCQSDQRQARRADFHHLGRGGRQRAIQQRPIGMFILSPFAKGGGKTAYSNSIHYDHSSTLKTLQEIFQVGPLLGAAADLETKALSDFFKGDCGDGSRANQNCGN